MGNRLRTASEPLPSMRFLANCLRQMPLSSSAHQCYARGTVRLSGRSFISKVTYLIPWPVKRAFPQHWPPAWKRGRKRFFGAQLSMFTHATKETSNTQLGAGSTLHVWFTWNVSPSSSPRAGPAGGLRPLFISQAKRSAISLLIFLQPNASLHNP